MAVVHIVGFAGSLRKKSYNKAALRAAQKLVPSDVTLEILTIDELPMYNQDIEEEQGDPPIVRNFKDKIRRADAVLIVTPEYNYSVPGVLKNAFDWISRPTGNSVLKNKPVAIMGASFGPYGTVRAQMSLRLSLGYVEATTLNKPDVFITFANQKFDEEGNLLDDQTRENIRALLAALVARVRPSMQ